MQPLGFHSETQRTVSRQAAVFAFAVVVAVVGLSAATASVQATAHADAALANQNDSHGGSVGDIVDVEVSVPDGATGQYFLGSRDVAYLTGVTFTDDGDGEVTLSVNTYLAGGHLGDERRAWSAESGRISNVTRYTEPLSEPLEPAVYDANQTIVGTDGPVTPLPLRVATVRDVTIATASANAFGEEPADIESTRTDRVAVGDTLVTRVDAAGVYGMLAAQPGETTTDRFRSLLGSNNASLGIDPATEDTDLDRSFENDAFDVYADADGGNLTVVTDTSALRYEDGTNGIEAGERYTVVFEIESESGLTIEEAAWADEFRATDRTVTFETGANGTVRLPSVADARLSGTTALAPGSELVVEARADGAFLLRNQTRIGEGGAFTTMLNLSAVEPGTEFVASIDDLVEGIPGVVVNASEHRADTGEGTTLQGTGTPGVTSPNGREPLTESQPADDESIRSPTATDTSNRSVTTTEADGPGFGATTALVAVVAVAGMAFRRRRSR